MRSSQKLRCDFSLQLLGNTVPVRVTGQRATIVVMPGTPIRRMECLFWRREESPQPGPCCLVGRPAENQTIVEENAANRSHETDFTRDRGPGSTLEVAMRFSERSHWEEEDAGFAVELGHARRSRPLIDLTVSNPTRCGFHYDGNLLQPLMSKDSLLYEPVPFGLASAREAVAAYYRDHGATVSPENICLTTSTSEAYGFLFQLLCDPGDEVLIARPSYPLFEVLARLHNVRLREYPLFYDPAHASQAPHQANSVGVASAWSIDLDELRLSVTDRTRAIVLVHPNNPTGNFVSAHERVALEAFCAEHALALIVDEVFLDYTLSNVASHTFATGETPALCFVLSGLSKVCALPQMKLSWIVARGHSDAVAKALHRLELTADTYLSLNTPVQRAATHWLSTREGIQQQIRERMICNLEHLLERLLGTHASALAFEGGWTVVLRVPRHVNSVEFATACLERGVVVQPGDLYGLPAGRVVLSLLTSPDMWADGLSRLPIT